MPYTYAALLRHMLEEQAEEYPNLKYALIDINGDGVEELLLQSEHSPLFPTYDENMFFAAIAIGDGELAYLLEGGCHYLCQGNIIESLFPFPDAANWHNYHFYDAHFRDEPVEAICPEEGKLFHSVRGGAKVEITEEAARAIVAQYPRMEIDFKPANTFGEGT